MISLKQNILLSGVLLLVLSGCGAPIVSEPVKSDVTKTTVYSYQCEDDNHVVVTLTGDEGYLFWRQFGLALSRQPEAGVYTGDNVRFILGTSPGLAPGQTANIYIHGEQLKGCKNNSRAAVWEAAKLNGVSYRAIGQEPAWYLEIRLDTGFKLVTDYGTTEVLFPYTEPDVDQENRRTRYEIAIQNETLIVEIHGMECRDTMSGEVFSSKVTVTWSGKLFTGCGRALH